MNRLFVFGDSFSHPNRVDIDKLPLCEFIDDKFFTFYRIVAEKLKAECYNFSLSGSGPQYTMLKFHQALYHYKFKKNDYIVLLLSDPSRDYNPIENDIEEVKYVELGDRPHYGFENIRNLIYLQYMSKYFFPEVKFFCNVIWKESSFFEGEYYSSREGEFGIHQNDFPSKDFKFEKLYNLNDSNNWFYLCDCELGIIHMKEFKKKYKIYMSHDRLHFTHNEDSQFKVKAEVNDSRVNHMSQRTHNTFANIILDFFINNKRPINTDNFFETGFLDYDDPHLIPREFIYE